MLASFARRSFARGGPRGAVLSTAPPSWAQSETPKERFRKRLDVAKAAAVAGGGAARVAKQHEKGKLTARERLTLLLDPGSFREYDMLKQHRCTEFDMEKQLIPGVSSERHDS